MTLSTQHNLSCDNHEPELSVVVAIIAGGNETAESCLRALEASAKSHQVQCIVPYDARLAGVSELTKRFSWVEFVDVRSEIRIEEFGNFSREHHDILRAHGLRRANGKVVALLEDHAPPASDWCTAVLQAHQSLDAAVGGAVENGMDRILNWAVYYCDFGRYQSPLPVGAAEFLSDCNAAYKREALMKVKNLWLDAFHESSINWELRKQGESLRNEPRMVVYQTRSTLNLLPALRERYVWGRSFAGNRSSEISLATRIMYLGFSFLLPFVLTWRIATQALRKRRHLSRLLLALPLIFVLETIWSVGEFTGYLTGRTGRSLGQAPAHQHV